MAFNDFMGKVRQIDTSFARWMMRHFYFLFFQIILIIIFFIFLYEVRHTLDQLSSIDTPSRLEVLVGQMSLNHIILIALAILNSFWMLYMFNILERLRVILKDISYQLMRRRNP